MIRKLLNKLVSTINLRLKKNQKKVIYHSFPDFLSNTFSMFLYLHSEYKSFKHIWLVDSINRKHIYIDILKNNNINIEEVTIVSRKSFLGLYHFLTSKYVFHSHGLFNSIQLSSKQIKVNLWHGMPIKTIGHATKNRSSYSETPKSNYHTVTSEFFQKIVAKSYRVSNAEVLISGQTRNDLLLNSNKCVNHYFNNGKSTDKTIFWMPTYRKSTTKGMPTDGKQNNDFLNKDDLSLINKTLVKLNSICYLKIHPIDDRNVDGFDFSNIILLTNADFEKNSIQLYSIFNSVDILLTDFSSIYVDFLLLNKPVGFVFSDFDEFSNSRGLAFSNPLEYMAGEIITDTEKLIQFFVDSIEHKIDNHKEKRERIKKIFHQYENNFSKIIFDKINENH